MTGKIRYKVGPSVWLGNVKTQTFIILTAAKEQLVLKNKGNNIPVVSSRSR
jgi:hypothetical protein